MIPQNMNILIIDDDDVDREALRTLCSQHCLGAEFEEAADERSALAFINGDQKFDCIFIDYRLPSCDGLELVEAILRKPLHRFAAIIVVTGSGDEEVAVKAMHSGAQDYLVKGNISEPSLVRALDNACKRVKLEENLHHQLQVQKNFASLAAHELKSPLNNVSGFLQLAELELSSDNETIVEYLASASNSLKYMNGLVNSLLVYANSGESSEEKIQVDLHSVVDMALDLLRPEIASSGAKVIAEDLPTITGKPDEMVQVFRNLIANAIRYKAQEAPIIEMTAQKTGKLWRITVTDNGIGVPENMRSKIFEPLQRAHMNTASGHGLGLAIVSRIVQSHGGKVWCEGGDGSGSKFVMTIPD